jgi:hypothetical protein
MIIIENFGIKDCSGAITGEYPINIYNDDKLIAHLGNEFVSMAFKIIGENLNSGDIFKFRILDNNNEILEETNNIFEKIEKGRIYYEPILEG